MTDESDKSDETHEPRRAVIGAVGGGVLASVGAWWLSRGDDASSEPQSAATTPSATETQSRTDTRTQVSTGTQTQTQTETQTPRETPTPTDRPTPTDTQTQTATEPPTATPTELNRAVVTHRGERTEIELTHIWTDVRVISFDAEIIDDPTRIQVRLFVRNTSDEVYDRLGALATVPDPPTNVTGVSVIDDRGRNVDTDVSPGARASLYPRVEWHPDLDRVEVVVDSGRPIQQTRTKTPTATPTPTEGGFL